jgi:hypothetical protein
MVRRRRARPAPQLADQALPGSLLVELGDVLGGEHLR